MVSASLFFLVGIGNHLGINAEGICRVVGETLKKFIDSSRWCSIKVVGFKVAISGGSDVGGDKMYSWIIDGGWSLGLTAAKCLPPDFTLFLCPPSTSHQCRWRICQGSRLHMLTFHSAFPLTALIPFLISAFAILTCHPLVMISSYSRQMGSS